MADQIFTGSGFKLFYNDDTANRIPDNAGNELVNELAAMPSFGIDSQVQTIEVYNSEFSEKLLAEQNVNDIDIVVNYVPDCTAHAFLDQATEDQTEFQLTLQYAVTDGIISYSMVNGMISSARLAGDKDSVVTKSYTFTPTDVLVRDGQAPLSTGLVVGSYGVGSNGVDVPQYEPQLPNGNSFIKVPAARNDNPASADLMGIGLIDSGTFSSIAMTKSGTLAIYAKNQNTAWTRILTATQISDQYVPITRKINGKALNADITITKSDVGLGNVTNDAQLKAASNLSDLADVAAAKTVLGIKGAANFDVIPITNGGTGANTVATARTNLQINRLTQGASYTDLMSNNNTTRLRVQDNNAWGGSDGTNWIALGVGQGGTGATNVTNAKINLSLDRFDQWASETWIYNPSKSRRLGLSSDNSWGCYSDTEGKWIPLEILKGGTGANTVAGAKTNLGLDVFVSGGTQTIVQSPNKANYMYVNDSGVWGGYSSSGAIALGVGQGGTGATTAAAARTNLGVAGLADNNTYTAANTYNGKSNFNGDITVSGNFDNSASNPLSIKSSNPTMSFIESDETNSTYLFVADGGNFRLNRDTTSGTNIFTYSRVNNSLTFGAGTVSVPQLTASGIVSGGISATSAGYTNVSIITTGAGDNKVGSRNVLEVTSDASSFYLVRRNNLNSTGQYIVTFPTSGGTLALAGTSDANFKRDIKNVDGSQSLENIRKVNPVTFIYTEDDKGRTRRGVIAQELELIDPNYVKHTKEISEEVDENGDPIMRERLVVDNNPLLMDTVISTKLLAEENDSLKAQIADQQLQLDELRAVVTQLLIAQNK